jgi:hypothetical protein
MSRLIKFKLYNKQDGLIPWGICQTYDLGYIFSQCGDDVWQVMQFTGLHDSTAWEQLTKQEQEEFINNGNSQENWKGKEIYEGDILDSEHKNPCAVEFIDGCFYGSFYTEGMGNLKVAHPYRLASFNHKMKIIANIKTHPELLEK